MGIIIPKFPELSFDESTHTYRVDQIILPSVTTLMKPLSDDLYRTISPEILERAAQRGTAIHNAIENYIAFGVRDIPSQYVGYFEAFTQWWDKRKPQPLALERAVYHKILMYAGTADLICMIDGRLTLVDYKSSAQINEKLCAVQLEGYDRAFESHGINIEQRLILHLSNQGYQEATFQRSAKCWSVFSALLTIKHYIERGI